MVHGKSYLTLLHNHKGSHASFLHIWIIMNRYSLLLSTMLNKIRILTQILNLNRHHHDHLSESFHQKFDSLDLEHIQLWCIVWWHQTLQSILVISKHKCICENWCEGDSSHLSTWKQSLDFYIYLVLHRLIGGDQFVSLTQTT